MIVYIKFSPYYSILLILKQMANALDIALQNNIERISGAILADIALNNPNNLKYPCSICNKNCLKNQLSILCDGCEKWCHLKCDGTTTLEQYKLYEETEGDPSIKWYCLYCKMKERQNYIPFFHCNASELYNINTSDDLEICKHLPSLEVVHQTSSFSKYNLPDVDDIPNLTTSKYHRVSEFHDLNKQANFNIFHSNVNGLEGKFDDLHNFLGASKTAMDVIAITETSEDKDKSFIKNVDIKDYKLHSTPSLSQKGGTALYVSTRYNFLERTDLNIQNEDFESIWVEIKNTNSKNIICGCIYRHPRQNTSSFMEYMDSTLCQLSKENKEIYVCGDFNIDLIKTDSNKSSSDFFNLLNCNGLLPLIFHPSRVVDGVTPSLIDNIFSNNINHEILGGNIYLTLSEHFSQFASINRGKIDVKKIVMFGRDTSKFNLEEYRRDVASHTWIQNSDDANVIAVDLICGLDEKTSKAAPVKKLNPKEVKTRLNPWITNDILKLIRIRDRLFARKKRQPCNQTVIEAYNRVRNQVSREIEMAKTAYQKSYFEEHSSNLKKTWEGIKKIVNVKKTTDFTISQLNIKGKLVDNPLDINNHFNDFFVNVGPETEKTVPKVPNISHEKFLKNRNQVNLIIAHISEEEVLEILKSLPTNKGTGPSSIPTKFLLMIADLVIAPLSNLINVSFSTGVFPDILKTAKVIPLHKGGSTQELNNFRPISLLSIFDKIMEKLMHKRLYSFIEEHNILFKNQFGFRKGSSTAHSLIEITEKIKESIDNGKFGCGIFIDLKKAFDTVNHKILLSKLEHYGVRGNILKWFESYLTDRKQYVFYNGISSTTKSLSCGVPQGSVLGPLLFLIYINDLPNISEKLSFFLFADDTNIYYESDNLLDLEKTVNEELKKLCLWLNINRLALNVGKTNFVIFRANKKLTHNVTLVMNKKALEQKDHVKYLGVLIDQHLKWNYHISNISKKISRGVGILAKLRNYMDTDLLKTIYYCLVYSHASYGIHAWGSACNSECEKINILIKKAARIMTGNQYFQMYGEPAGPLPSAEPLYKELNILNLHDIFDLNVAKFIYSTLSGLSPEIFSNWFTYTNTIHSHATTSSVTINQTNYFDIGTTEPNKTLFTKNSNLVKYGARMISVYGPTLWNRLPKKIQDSASLATFKIQLKKYLISQYNSNSNNTDNNVNNSSS